MAATFKYDDPQMVHVGAFTNDEGLQRIAQKGTTYYHFTDRKPRAGDPVSVDYKGGLVPVRFATITRDNGNVGYHIEWGPPTPARTLSGITAALPADMRRKKFVISSALNEPVKI
jgi:hypothetical protein